MHNQVKRGGSTHYYQRSTNKVFSSQNTQQETAIIMPSHGTTIEHTSTNDLSKSLLKDESLPKMEQSKTTTPLTYKGVQEVFNEASKFTLALGKWKAFSVQGHISSIC